MKSRLEKFTGRDGAVYINPAHVVAVRVVNDSVEIEVSSGAKDIVKETEEMVIGQLEG